tara:strand:- start:47520 stop:47822 length:303 start_codon:yes stop_codon:yes gene_type:complete
LSYAFEVVEDIACMKTQDCEALGFHPLVAVFVVIELIALALVAVDFDDESGCVAVEISDVWAEGMLGSEMQVVEFFGFDCSPQDFFWWGEFSAEFLGTLA